MKKREKKQVTHQVHCKMKILEVLKKLKILYHRNSAEFPKQIDLF